MISIEQKRFTGGVEFTENGELFLIDVPGEPAYVGEPNGDIDEAWHHILDGRYFSLSEREAKNLWGKDYDIYRDHAMGGFTGVYDENRRKISSRISAYALLTIRTDSTCSTISTA